MMESPMSFVQKSWGRILVLDADEVCSFTKFFNVFARMVVVRVAPERRVSVEVTSNDC